MMMNAMQTLARQAPGALARHAPRAAGAALSTMASRGLLQAARQQRAASTMAGRSLPQASRQGALGAARHGATRDISVGRDGRHWNTVLLMVPQAEEWSRSAPNPSLWCLHIAAAAASQPGTRAGRSSASANFPTRRCRASASPFLSSTRSRTSGRSKRRPSTSTPKRPLPKTTSTSTWTAPSTRASWMPTRRVMVSKIRKGPSRRSRSRRCARRSEI